MFVKNSDYFVHQYCIPIVGASLSPILNQIQQMMIIMISPYLWGKVTIDESEFLKNQQKSSKKGKKETKKPLSWGSMGILPVNLIYQK